MKPNAAQIRTEEDRKRRRADERFRRWIEDLRRRRKMRAERDRRRRWLLMLLLWVLESKPLRMFFTPFDSIPAPKSPPTTPRRKRRARDETEPRPAFDHDEHIFWDYSTRTGEHHLHVMDGLTYEDIIELRRLHQPYQQTRKPQPIAGMPQRYADEPPHVWTLLFHLQYDFLRPDAISALKLLVDPAAYNWIDACAATDEGWKELRRCRAKTPEITIAEFPRAAARWRAAAVREAEERLQLHIIKPDEGEGNMKM